VCEIDLSINIIISLMFVVKKKKYDASKKVTGYVSSSIF
jgi:hypothetical protein